MSHRTLSRCLVRVGVVAIIAASALSLSAGCQSKTDKAAAATVKSVGDFQKQLDQMPALIDSTMDRLVATTTGQNARRADDFREFQKDLAAMRSRANMVALEYEKANRNSSEYFRQWMRESDRTDPAMRSAMDAKIAGSETNRNIALGHFASARRDFTSLVNSLNGIEKSLINDMSEANVQAAGRSVGAAITDAGKLKDQIARLDEMIGASFAIGR